MHLKYIVIKFQTPALTGKMGPRVCKRHFHTTDIIVNENSTRLKKDVLPKSDIRGDTDNNLIFCSSEGVNFPTNLANIAKNSPFIRRILEDWREEDQVILVDLDTRVLSIVLNLFYGISIPFKKILYEKVKDALKLFEIDETLVRIEAEGKEKGEKENRTENMSTAEVNYDDEEPPIIRTQSGKQIDCPFPDCSFSTKERRIFLKHLCDHHFKEEIEDLMKGRKSETTCSHQDCQFSTKSIDNRNLRHHIAITHKHINVFFVNKFPKSPLIKKLKLT